MKRVNSLSFTSVGREGVLSAINKLLLCLLIPLGVLIAGCDPEEIIGDWDRDMEDLSNESLKISLDIDKSELDIGEAINLTVKLPDDIVNKAELKYYWSVSENGGTIHGTGKSAIYVAPEKKGTYTIILQVSNGIVSVSDFCIVKVLEP